MLQSPTYTIGQVIFLDSKPARIRVLIIDDHPVVRYGLVHMLGTAADLEVVGELENIDGLAATLETLRPDVVLLDLELGEGSGIDALRQVHDANPPVRVVIYTSHDEEQSIIQAAEYGVDGYLLKGCPQDELIRAIRSVCDGGTALEASVAAKLMHHMNARSTANKATTVLFSKREKQVLDLLAQGKINREIGLELFISESTVKFHVHAILKKLDAGNRTEAVSIAAQQGIIKLGKSGES